VRTVNTPQQAAEGLEAAATVVVLRDGPVGLETLLVRRTTRLAFAGGHWVFPGGRIEHSDRHNAAQDDELGAARRAAVRETAEETAVALDPDALVWFAHWTPPPTAPRRYATYFFATAAPTHDQDVTVDGSETDAWAWMTPEDAIARRDQGVVELRPATWITLHRLRRFPTTEATLDALAHEPVEHFATRLDSNSATPIALYDGDAGYETIDASVPGPRHRLVMGDGRWHYERDDALASIEGDG
jgi:8-oxo-dGTP pyrophosphatase MutT (NUDIX family)